MLNDTQTEGLQKCARPSEPGGVEEAVLEARRAKNREKARRLRERRRETGWQPTAEQKEASKARSARSRDRHRSKRNAEALARYHAKVDETVRQKNAATQRRRRKLYGPSGHKGIEPRTRRERSRALIFSKSLEEVRERRRVARSIEALMQQHEGWLEALDLVRMAERGEVSEEEFEELLAVDPFG